MARSESSEESASRSEDTVKYGSDEDAGSSSGDSGTNSDTSTRRGGEGKGKGIVVSEGSSVTKKKGEASKTGGKGSTGKQLQSIPQDNVNNTWTLFTDGSSSQHGSGIGIKMVSPTGEILEQSFRQAFISSNNEAEYEALLAGCRLALENGVRKVHVRCDSQLVVNHLNGDFSARDERMTAYRDLASKLRNEFEEFTIIRTPRGENSAADALASLASTSEPTQKRIIPVEILEKPSVIIPSPRPSF